MLQKTVVGRWGAVRGQGDGTGSLQLGQQSSEILANRLGSGQCRHSALKEICGKRHTDTMRSHFSRRLVKHTEKDVR